MAEIIKVYRQSVPSVRFIGKIYGDSDRVDGGFGKQWGDWFASGLFEKIEKQLEKTKKKAYEDCDAYVGLMRWKDGEPFQYWIGMFTPEGTAVPEGFSYHDFPASELGVCWVYGKDVYCKEDKCAEKLAENGMKVSSDSEGAFWFFERYTCPRFTSPDEKGNVILDICHYVEKQV